MIPYLRARVFLATYARVFGAPLLPDYGGGIALQALDNMLLDKTLRDIDLMSKETLLDVLETLL